MTRAELVETWAPSRHSGSKAFMQALKTQQARTARSSLASSAWASTAPSWSPTRSKVCTRPGARMPSTCAGPAMAQPATTLKTLPDQHRGCRMVLKLKEDAEEFCKEANLKRILAKYLGLCQLSSTPQWRARQHRWRPSGWTPKSEASLTSSTPSSNRFATHAFDDPRYRLPLQRRRSPRPSTALLFTSLAQNVESYGAGPDGARRRLSTARRSSSTPSPPSSCPTGCASSAA